MNPDDFKTRIAHIRRNIRPLMVGNEDETWRQALHRFQQLTSQDVDAFIDEDSGELVIINLANETGTPAYICERAESADQMQRYCAEHGFPVPAQLIELMCGHGCFRMPAGSSRHYAEIYTTWKDSGDDSRRIGWSLKTIQDALKWNFGSVPEGLFTAQELQHLDRELLFWGYFSAEDDGNYTYMFVDRVGKYGLFQYNEGNWPETRHNFIEPITRGTDDRYDLDKLVSKLVDSVIVRTFERHDIPIAGDTQVSVAFESFSQVAKRYGLASQPDSRAEQSASRTASVGDSDATLRLVWDGRQQHLTLEINHGPSQAPQAGGLQLFARSLPDGEFFPADELNDELLDAIEHGFELMSPARP